MYSNFEKHMFPNPILKKSKHHFTFLSFIINFSDFSTKEIFKNKMKRIKLFVN